MLFHNVYRSMRFVLKSREREARAAAAAAAAESARDDRGRLIAKRDD
jgi:hypothetical protein